MNELITIVEDEDDIRALVVAGLKKERFRVREYADGKGFLASLRSEKPDLVILSAEAADNGLLKSLGGLKGRPAVLLTGGLDQYHRVWRAWQSGGDDVLIKPVMSGEELHLAIVTAMENATAGRRASHRRASA